MHPKKIDTFDLILKYKKNIFSILNLILLCSSILFSAINSFAAKEANVDQNHLKTVLSASQSSSDISCSQLLGEEIETEADHDLHVQSFVLPFSIVYLNLDSPRVFCISEHPSAGTVSNPIYLSVCNFRI